MYIYVNHTAALYVVEGSVGGMNWAHHLRCWTARKLSTAI